MTLILSGDITLRHTWQPMDPDAAAYITAVESADGQALEEPVKIAIDNFVLGCKADGIWDAIKASCILAGARTLSGALVPLAGTAPTNYNFVAGDYNRETGLVGDGSTKYLDSSRADSADPQNSAHLSVYVTSPSTSGSNTYSTYAGAGNNSNSFRSIYRYNAFVGGDGVSSVSGYNRSASRLDLADKDSTGLIAVNRATSSQITGRAARLDVGPLSTTSNLPATVNLMIFAENGNGTPSARTNARFAFYSIGESLDLALLDARVTDLINKFAEVIP